MKFKLFCLTALIIFFLSPLPIVARKRLVRSVAVSGSSAASVWVKPILRSDHNALILAFGNLNLASQLTYRLTYISGSIPQGIEGSHQPETANFQTELLFGTCSGSNCTYHQNLADMILEISVKLNSGKTLVQRYQIKP
ncbi:MAG: hypothetical protein V1810_00575 [Candidatus Beckwithbacteria bacterium]